MLHLLLVDTLSILFRFLLKYLEISLIRVGKKLGPVKLTSVSSAKCQTRTASNITLKSTYKVIKL